MYTKKVFSLKGMAMWTRYETLLFFIISLVYVLGDVFFGFSILRIPWTPLALVGTAVAFVIGFQNNSAYGRIWEARMIWGGIVNTSRTFGTFVKEMVTNEYALEKVSETALKQEIKTLTYRHIAWMTALRHAMRQPKSWETVLQHKTNKEWDNMVKPPERLSNLEDDLKPYLNADELTHVLSKGNKQTAILYLQSAHLRRLKEKGIIWEFSYLELEALVQELFTQQGKSERIKNFPYPRHFASLNHYFIWIFLLLLPLGVVPQFAEIGREIISQFPLIGKHFVWLAIPFCVIVSWVFHTMERIGRTGENPFEGTANDVPISTIARGIEIDLRENLDENKEDIPKQFPEVYNVQF